MFGRKRKKALKQSVKTSSEQAFPVCTECGKVQSDLEAAHCCVCGSACVVPKTQVSEQTCPKCNHVIEVNAKFCPTCGCNVGRTLKKSQKKKEKKKKKIDKELKRIGGEEAIMCANDLAGFKLMYENGIAVPVDGRFSTTMEFSDVSYENEREDTQDFIFAKLCALHHYFQAGQVYQLNLMNVRRYTRAVERYLPEVGANADMAKAYNDIIEARQREGRVEFDRKNFISFSVAAEDLEGAQTKLRSIREGVTTHLTRMHSNVKALDGAELAHTIHDTILGASHPFHFDYERLKRTRKIHVRDYVSPAWAIYPAEERVLRRYIQTPTGFVKTLHIKDFGSDLQDSALRTIRALPVAMNISLTFCPQPKAKIKTRVRQNIDVVQAEMQNYSQAVGKSGGDPTLLPPALEDKEADGRDLLHFMEEKNQQVAFFQGFITIFATTAEQLAHDTQLVVDECSAWTLDVVELPTQQEEALISSLPLACPRLDKKYRSLTNAESAALIPFASQSITDDPKTSYHLGVDATSGEAIFVDPNKTKSPHMFVFGFTGSGKGMQMNSIISYSMLQHPRRDIDQFTGKYINTEPLCPEWHIVDWHDEYWELGDKFGASCPQFGPGHKECINVMGISNSQGELEKSDVAASIDTFIAIVESCIKDRSLTNAEVTALDSATRAAYAPHIGKNSRPDLRDLYEELKKDNSESAKSLVDALGSFVHGSFNSFCGQTNININPQMNVYRMSEVGENMRTIAILAVLQHVRTRAYQNFLTGKQTFLVFEECQIVFENEPAMRVLESFFAEMRKFGLKMINITQLPSAVVRHKRAQNLFENTGIFIFLPQNASNQDLIADTFNLSQAQAERLDSGADAGTGLVMVDGLKVPMNNRIPKDNPLFDLWNTDADKYAKRKRAESKGK